jgi:hypothetical protein
MVFYHKDSPVYLAGAFDCAAAMFAGAPNPDRASLSENDTRLAAMKKQKVRSNQPVRVNQNIKPAA